MYAQKTLKFLKPLPIKYTEGYFLFRSVRQYRPERTGLFMNVNKYSSYVSAYVKNTYEPVKKKQSVSVSKNVDKAEFSAASKEGAVSGAKASVKRSVESYASAERIAALKSMIADGSYNVSAENVAASILEG